MGETPCSLLLKLLRKDHLAFLVPAVMLLTLLARVTAAPLDMGFPPHGLLMELSVNMLSLMGRPEVTT